MFAEALHDARGDARLSIARVAELAGTSRAAITDYEAGRKIPRVDTAEHILEALGRTLSTARSAPQRHVRLDDDIMAPLAGWSPRPETTIRQARENQAVIVDADASAERLDVTWGQVKTVVGGITVEGDEWSVWRVRELADSTENILRTIESGEAPRLSVIADDTLIEADASLPVPRQAMDFLVRATQLGADPAFTRHQAGGFLAHHGYPWLWVPHRLGAEYRRALVACRRQGEGNLMARVLVASIEPLD